VQRERDYRPSARVGAILLRQQRDELGRAVGDKRRRQHEQRASALSDSARELCKPRRAELERSLALHTQTGFSEGV